LASETGSGGLTWLGGGPGRSRRGAWWRRRRVAGIGRRRRAQRGAGHAGGWGPMPVCPAAAPPDSVTTAGGP
jgi:hypothetical protein